MRFKGMTKSEDTPSRRHSDCAPAHFQSHSADKGSTPNLLPNCSAGPCPEVPPFAESANVYFAESSNLKVIGTAVPAAPPSMVGAVDRAQSEGVHGILEAVDRMHCDASAPSTDLNADSAPNSFVVATH